MQSSKRFSSGVVVVGEVPNSTVTVMLASTPVVTVTASPSMPPRRVGWVFALVARSLLQRCDPDPVIVNAPNALAITGSSTQGGDEGIEGLGGCDGRRALKIFYLI